MSNNHFPSFRACRRMSRREAIKRAGAGFGMLALASLLRDNNLLAAEPAINQLAPKTPHFTPRAKAVIWIFINGGPSQVDTWDYKPELVRRDGLKLDGYDPHTGFFAKEVGPLMKSPFKFAQYGESGTWASDLFPHLSQ